MHVVVGPSGFLRSTFEEATKAGLPHDSGYGGGGVSWGKQKTGADWKGLWPELGVLPLNSILFTGIALNQFFLHPPCHWDIFWNDVPSIC